MAQSDVLRNLKIKTSTLKRLQKELGFYAAEKDKEQARVAQMRADNADAHDLRQAENVLAESAMMVPETRSRLESALGDLQAYVREAGQEANGSEEMAAAKEAIDGAETVFAS